MTTNPISPPTGNLPAYDAFLITPSNSTDLAQTVRSIYVGGGGDINLDTPAGNTVLFVAVPQGLVLPVQAKRVRSTSTTASLMVGLV